MIKIKTNFIIIGLFCVTLMCMALMAYRIEDLKQVVDSQQKTIQSLDIRIDILNSKNSNLHKRSIELEAFLTDKTNTNFYLNQNLKDRIEVLEKKTNQKSP